MVVTVILEPVLFPQVLRNPIIQAPWGNSSAAAGAASAEIKDLMAIFFGTFCKRTFLRPKGITLEIEVSHHAAVITFHLSP